MVQLLGEAGIPQVIVARRADRLEDLAARYEGVEVLAADLTTAEGFGRGRGSRSPTRNIRIDLVVNNAGFGTSGEFHDPRSRSARRRDRAEHLGVDRDQSSCARRDGAARARISSQRQQRCQLPARTEAGRLRRHQGIRHLAVGEPARGGAWHWRARHGVVPGPDAHRVPECQQQRLVRGRVPVVRLAFCQRCGRSRAARCRQGPGAVDSWRAVQGDGRCLEHHSARV